jgi:membrane-associated phospholipid phosphatase
MGMHSLDQVIYGFILGAITLATFINLIQPFFLAKIYEIYQDEFIFRPLF